MRAPRIFLLVGVLLPVAGCQRGCLAAWLDARGIGRGSEAPPPHAVPLHGVDCPDGLARCVAGSVEVSRLARVPENCVGRPSECACPWDVVASCPRGCAADAVSLVLSPEEAAAQLCALRDDEIVARPPAARQELPNACDGEEHGHHVSVASTVAVSDADDAGGVRPRSVGVCVHGCAAGPSGAIEVDERLTDAQAIALLCARESARP